MAGLSLLAAVKVNAMQCCGRIHVDYDDYCTVSFEADAKTAVRFVQGWIRQ